MPTFLADSKQLKEDLVKLNNPPGAKIFTADATSMYTNLKTKFAMDALVKYLTKNQEKFRYLPLKAIKTAMTIIMTLNVFTFGDAHFLQLTRAAMGTPPVPDYMQTTFNTHGMQPKRKRSGEHLKLLNMWFGLEWEIIVSNKSAGCTNLTITLEN
eukprot:1910747-Ditylum_brightwellii.AAC.1